MREFSLEIVTPDGVVYDGACESVLVRTADGDVEIMAGHVDYMASLGTGRARIKVGGTDRIAASSGGFIAVNEGKVRIVAVTFEFSEDIDLDRAKRAKAVAEESIRTAEDAKELALAKAKLLRALARINAHDA